MDIPWQVCFGNESWEKSSWLSMPIPFIVNSLGYSNQSTSTTSRWLENMRMCLKCGLNCEPKVDLEDPIPILDQVYLGCTQRQAKSQSKKCSTKAERTLKHGAMTWKVMLLIVLISIANWINNQWTNFTESPPHLVSMITKSK